MLDASSFKMHVRMKDRITKGERVEHLYGQYTFDTAIPLQFAECVQRVTNATIDEAYSEFVWLYFDHNAMGQPAPLSERGCDILLQYELSYMTSGLSEHILEYTNA